LVILVNMNIVPLMILSDYTQSQMSHKLKQAKQTFQLKCCTTMLHMFQAFVATINLVMLYYQHCHVSKYETPMLHLHVAPLTFHKLTILKQT
jgi:hypothetical protein